MNDEILANIGRCIYCGKRDIPLSREHIVPYGLNGIWVLENASCQVCANITSRFERYILRTQLLQPRAGLAFRTRRPKKRPDRFPIELILQGKREIRDLDTTTQPIFLWLPLYDWPGCIKAEERKPTIQLGEINLAGGDLIQVAGKPFPEFRDWLIAEQIDRANIRGKFKPSLFARMIAKIAYGFAVADFGIDNIEEAYVLPGILGKSQDIGQWVGCDLDASPTAKEQFLHIRVYEVEGNIYGQVQLFAPFKTQVYLVAVGKLK